MDELTVDDGADHMLQALDKKKDQRHWTWPRYGLVKRRGNVCSTPVGGNQGLEKKERYIITEYANSVC